MFFCRGDKDHPTTHSCHSSGDLQGFLRGAALVTHLAFIIRGLAPKNADFMGISASRTGIQASKIGISVLKIGISYDLIGNTVFFSFFSWDVEWAGFILNA